MPEKKTRYFRKPKPLVRIPQISLDDPQLNPWIPKQYEKEAKAKLAKKPRNPTATVPFNMMLYPEIHTYLQKVAPKNRSKYVRKLIWDDMGRRNKDFQMPPTESYEFMNDLPDIGFTYEEYPMMYLKHQIRLLYAKMREARLIELERQRNSSDQTTNEEHQCIEIQQTLERTDDPDQEE